MQAQWAIKVTESISLFGSGTRNQKMAVQPKAHQQLSWILLQFSCCSRESAKSSIGGEDSFILDLGANSSVGIYKGLLDKVKDSGSEVQNRW